MDIIKAFFGWNDPRTPEPFFSWQHLLYVGVHLLIAFSLAVILGIRDRKKAEEDRRKVVKAAAVAMIVLEAVKIILMEIRCCVLDGDAGHIRSMLPLWLCSTQLIMIPVAAFNRGRIGKAAADFVAVFGLVGCVGGTVLASNYFGQMPVLRFEIVDSVATHSISGFCALYLLITGGSELKLKNTPLVALYLAVFMGLSLLANAWNADSGYQANYMFLQNDGGTPFFLCTMAAGGSQTLYTVFAILLHYLCLAAYMGVVMLIRKTRGKNVSG
ncbi:MAG: hypothetical protein CW338_00120 [Clostridiales bacterium]|nr:hypothetical protein [Clostridiales bacterium]